MKKTSVKKRVYNLIELILQGVLLAAIWILPTVNYSYNRYEGNITYNGTVSLSLGGYFFDQEVWGGYILLALMIVNCILCLVSIFGNATDKDGKIHVVVPIVSLILGVLLLTSDMTPTGLHLVISEVFGIAVIGIMLIITLLAIVKRSSAVSVVETTQTQGEVLSQPNVAPQIESVESNAEELNAIEKIKKYKDLLDSGAITQEEYDTKKKELLNL